MCVRFFKIGEYAQSVLFLIYFLLAIKGVFVWTKKEKNEAQFSEQKNSVAENPENN